MYIPSYFRMGEPDEFAGFIRDNSFGVLVSTVDGRPFATHLPFFYDPGQNVLSGHMARANPQWRNLDGQTVLAVFSGPHAYISPSWYESSASVPTWNYVAAHVYGKCTVIGNDGELADLLERMVRFYEPDSNLPMQADQAFYRNLMKAIVGFRIEITDVQGAAKLSQNKPFDVQERVIANLRLTGDPVAQSVAKWMRNRLDGVKGADPIGNA